MPHLPRHRVGGPPGSLGLPSRALPLAAGADSAPLPGHDPDTSLAGTPARPWRPFSPQSCGPAGHSAPPPARRRLGHDTAAHTGAPGSGGDGHPGLEPASLIFRGPPQAAARASARGSFKAALFPLHLFTSSCAPRFTKYDRYPSARVCPRPSPRTLRPFLACSEPRYISQGPGPRFRGLNIFYA